LGEVASVTFIDLQLVETRREPMPKDERFEELLARCGFNKRPQESFWVVSYDPMKYIRTVYEVAKGGPWQMEVHIPMIMTAVLKSGCDRFIVAHNHPSGTNRPSAADIELTANIMDAANACGLYFDDHLIIGPGRSKPFSFAKAGMMLPAKYGQKAASGVL
jgi:DNA repair protein RadC